MNVKLQKLPYASYTDCMYYFILNKMNYNHSDLLETLWLPLFVNKCNVSNVSPRVQRKTVRHGREKIQQDSLMFEKYTCRKNDKQLKVPTRHDF